ncbi:hypothetical protein CDAR_239861 [Caerostris darwini]|uniref:Uncharacterized protein n=1 Tax=Caerostris darwini TaxID=1538125 RepID=A0AAV4QYN3_9ARAC|nr:hypothetical protein CDAR_239861 [Caerostris darwini]
MPGMLDRINLSHPLQSAFLFSFIMTINFKYSEIVSRARNSPHANFWFRAPLTYFGPDFPKREYFWMVVLPWNRSHFLEGNSASFERSSWPDAGFIPVPPGGKDF